VWPKEIDWRPGNGDPAWLGIYEIKGNELLFCFVPPGKERPKAFRDDAQNSVRFHVRKRVQQTAKE
jgi:hypothetical protein